MATTAQLQTITVPVTRLRANPWNPNRMSDAVFNAERESIRRFGFIDPITTMVDPDDVDMFLIIDGEHRWRAAPEEGHNEVPIVVLDVTIDEAKRLTIVLNETRGDADVVLLGQLLTELRAAEPDHDAFREALPYSAAELDHLLSIGSVDWDQFAAGGGGGGGGGPAAEFEYVLAFVDEEQLSRFKEMVEILRLEYEHGADASVTYVVVDGLRRQALIANQA